jgi:elongation factor G
MTGDTLVQSHSAAKALARQVAEEAAPAHSSEAAHVDDADDAEGVVHNPAILASPHVPEPVFFCSVEAPSLAQQKQFELALACLAREDPSLRVTQVDCLGNNGVARS